MEVWHICVHSQKCILKKVDLPKSMAEKTNLCSLFLFFWKIVICVIAPPINMARNTAEMGISTLFSGAPPSDHICGAYGGPCKDCTIISYGGYGGFGGVPYL